MGRRRSREEYREWKARREGAASPVSPSGVEVERATARFFLFLRVLGLLAIGVIAVMVVSREDTEEDVMPPVAPGTALTDSRMGESGGEGPVFLSPGSLGIQLDRRQGLLVYRLQGRLVNPRRESFSTVAVHYELSTSAGLLSGWASLDALDARGQQTVSIELHRRRVRAGGPGAGALGAGGELSCELLASVTVVRETSRATFPRRRPDEVPGWLTRLARADGVHQPRHADWRPRLARAPHHPGLDSPL